MDIEALPNSIAKSNGKVVVVERIVVVFPSRGSPFMVEVLVLEEEEVVIVVIVLIVLGGVGEQPIVLAGQF